MDKTKQRFTFIFHYFHLKITKHQGTFLSILLVRYFSSPPLLVPRIKSVKFLEMTLSILFRNPKSQTDIKSGNSKCYWTSPSNVYLQGNFLAQRKSGSREFSKTQNDFPRYRCHLGNDNNFKNDIRVSCFILLNQSLKEINCFSIC